MIFAPPTLVAAAVVLAAAGLWELAGSRGESVGHSTRSLAARLTGGRVRTLSGAALWLQLPRRLERAGLAGRVPPSAVLAAKAGGAATGALAAVFAAPALPARLAVAIALLLPAAGFVAPEALLDREARRRRAHIEAMLPDALDLLAVGTAAGRSPAAVLGEIAGGIKGPLAEELARAVAEIQCGVPLRDAIESLRDRAPGSGLGAMASALERSRRHGSPLADQLHDQAAVLRRQRRRRIEERAGRAAPKIQLVVALALVPSVLLMIAAALIAHSDELLGAAP
jgi:tight adherence protein C